ncbi:hypothetical protein [Actinokineospora bangkokensis]|uniref:Uncharacterized protein n=1 Tax=Actinokineospora bangkokensis TaxID=1193682 RepID=A0A1Q9LEW7_9PSEU|nr:hypothetical protein [Actinokineospora bangkokensis]OLR90563.1 hypothetical protein BJP25_28490 [Actinokineospora bangkokensis]
MADRDVRRRVDPVTLVVGLLALGVAGFALSDGAGWGWVSHAPWGLGGVAVLVGLVLLAASRRRRGGGRG